MMESLNYFPKSRYLRFGKMLKEMERGVMECTTGIRPCEVIEMHRWDLLVLYKVEYLLGCSVISYWPDAFIYIACTDPMEKHRFCGGGYKPFPLCKTGEHFFWIQCSKFLL
jgi:hypothetical protein